ncbi:MAG: potassium-transporting ATPase subunit KdpC [Pirellulaceae bacterium]
MLQNLRTSITLLVALTVITGDLYPAIVTAVAQLAFRHQAAGSLIDRDGELVGSELIGQAFSQPEYFWGRLSATQPFACNAAASSGPNLGPMNPALVHAAEARIAALEAGGEDAQASVPVDLVTSSGSGLDPHISPAAADIQVPRVAAARRMSEDAVRKLVRQHTQGRQFGLLGEPRVNVLQLNLALDQRPNSN